MCASVTSVAAISFIAAALIRGFFGVSLLAGCLLGGCLGYLIWNWYPGKVMMGDTGSMFLGGMVVALAYAIDCPLIILLYGIIYVVEMLSDVLQICYFKATHGNEFSKWHPYTTILKCAAGKSARYASCLHSFSFSAEL